jgi:branched-chain amino acid transport system substrate-binding protein
MLRTHRVSGCRAAQYLAAALLAAACRPATPAELRREYSTKTSGDVVIGVAWPWAAHPDILFGQGADMAVAEVNASGGVNGRRLRLRREDDHESVDSGRVVAHRLSSDPSVVAVIGHLQSYVTIPAAAIYDEAGLVLLSPTATDPELTAHAYTRVFRATFTSSSVGRQMADYAAARGFKRVAIYYTRDDYGRLLSNAFEERANGYGMTVPARQSYNPGGENAERAFLGTFAAWKDLGIDALFVAGEVPSAGTLIAQARRAGLAVPVIGVDAMSSPALMSAGGRAVEGTVVPTPFHVDEPRAAVQRFNAAFRGRYRVAPDAGSALGYDAVWLLARAIRAAKASDPDSISRALHRARGWQAVTGAFTFDSAGSLAERPIITMVVRDGRFEYVPGAPAVAVTGP